MARRNKAAAAAATLTLGAAIARANNSSTTDSAGRAALATDQENAPAMSTTETVLQIPLERITESANNPRKRWTDEATQEMADSIASQGVLQPIVVREVANSLYQYEVVFGHRRYRGSIKASRETIPAIVRVMSDEEADQARLHENLEREDVHYIEEAEAMLRLMREHGVTAEQLMAQTGKKSTYVYGRLKLANLHQQVRDKCLAGVFSAEVATLIARWPAAVQPRAMQACLQDHFGMDPADKGKHSKSYRECKLALRHMAIPIASADFDPADRSLSILTPGALTGKASAAGTCTDCPDNTANDIAMAEHLGTEELHCLFRECFEHRDAEYARRAVETARADGRVVDSAVARSQPDLFGEHHWHGRISTAGVIAEAEEKGLEVPLPTLVLEGDRVTGRMYPKAAIEALKEQLFPASEKSTTTTRKDDDEDARAAWIGQLPADQQAVAGRESFSRVLAAICKAAKGQPRSADELRMVLLETLNLSEQFHDEAEAAMGWPADLDAQDDPTEERRALLAGMDAGELGALLVLEFICESVNQTVSPWTPKDRAEVFINQRLALAKRYGVDVLQAAQPAAAAPIDPQPGAAPDDGVQTPSAGTQPKGARGAVATTTAARPVRYRSPQTGETWSGRGLQPKWLKAALTAGRTLAEFEVGSGSANQSDDALAGGRLAEAAA
jgi:ParB/RepB/Spo0J family partition protein